MNMTADACIYCTIDLDEVSMRNSEMPTLLEKNENEEGRRGSMTGWTEV